MFAPTRNSSDVLRLQKGSSDGMGDVVVGDTVLNRLALLVFLSSWLRTSNWRAASSGSPL